MAVKRDLRLGIGNEIDPGRARVQYTDENTFFFSARTASRYRCRDGFECQVIRSRCAPGLEDETAALGEALDHPIGCVALAALAAGKESAVISVCDITRPAPNR